MLSGREGIRLPDHINSHVWKTHQTVVSAVTTVCTMFDFILIQDHRLQIHRLKKSPV